MRSAYVIVSGSPGSGKSSLARQLAAALDMPLLEKDVIKEAIAEVLPAADLEASQRLGAAATEALFALMNANDRAVVENAWLVGLARPRLQGAHRPIVEVFCDVPAEVAMDRYRARLGGIDGWRARNVPVDGGWPCRPRRELGCL